MSEPPAAELRIACDAMCGGLARWLRILGVDTSYTPGIEDGALVQHALAESRLVLSGDAKLFERTLFTHGRVRGLHVPPGMALDRQVEHVVTSLRLRPGFPRCSICNGNLEAVPRAAVADTVPAKSLIWATEFYRCTACRHVFWNGTHWRRINAVRERYGAIL